MKLPIYNLKAEEIDNLTLPKEVFEAKINQELLAQAIRIYLDNQRSAHAKTKHRGEVAGTTKKMWAQKGTGRARHGSAKAPIFVGGGSAHGPRGNRNYSGKLTKSQGKKALYSILSSFAKNKSIIIIDQLSQVPPKTKEAWKLIDLFEKINKTLSDSQKIGIISQKPITNLKRAFGNIPGFSLFSLMSLNPHQLAQQNFLIFSPKAIKAIK